MDELFQRIKKNWVICLISLICLFCMCHLCGCSSEAKAPPGLSNKDVSGTYLAVGGYQHVRDNQGYENKGDFSEADGIVMAVTQSGAAVSAFDCLGMLEEDLTITESHSKAVYYWDSEGCATTTCYMEFDDGTMYMEAHLEAYYPGFGYIGTNDIVLEMVLDHKLEDGPCGDTWELPEGDGGS